MIFQIRSGDYFRENSIFGRHFETEHFLNVLFADLGLLSYVYRYGASFVLKFLWKSTPKWLGPEWKKKSLGT